MSHKKRILLGAAALLVQLGMFGAAHADTVARCDNCSPAQLQSKALSSPLGWTYLVDYPNATLTLWEVRYDAEIRRKTADQTSVDPGTYNRFLYLLDVSVQAQAGGQSLVVVNVSPDNYNGTIFNDDPFGGFSNISAYDVVKSVTVRNQLGENIARAMSVGGSDNGVLTNLGMTLNSFMMSLGVPTGYKIVITWKDGTKTSMTIDSSSANQAKYVAGESKDDNTNPIPDSTASSGEGGDIFAGQFYFDDADSLQKWLDAAVMAGIPITGAPSGSNRLNCTWDGQKLDCSHQ